MIIVTISTPYNFEVGNQYDVIVSEYITFEYEITKVIEKTTYQSIYEAKFLRIRETMDIGDQE